MIGWTSFLMTLGAAMGVLVFLRVVCNSLLQVDLQIEADSRAAALAAAETSKSGLEEPRTAKSRRPRTRN